MKSEKEFNPIHVKCAKCGDIIYSKYQGQYVSCKCGAIHVDQTAQYRRYLGDPKDFIYLDEKEQQ